MRSFADVPIQRHYIVLLPATSSTVTKQSYCHSFRIQQLDCRLETHVVWLFSFNFILWNFIWLIDFIKSFKRPMYTTIKYMPAYTLTCYGTCVAMTGVLLRVLWNSSFYKLGPMFTCNMTDRLWICISMVLEGAYMLTATVIFFRYGKQNIIEKFKRSGRKLSFFFGVQKWYLGIFFITWFIKLLELFNEFLNPLDYTKRMKLKLAFAIIHSARPALLVIPWMTQMLVNFCQPVLEREQLLQDSALRLKENMNEALREEVAEYLLKGISKSLNAVHTLETVREIRDEEETTCCCCIGTGIKSENTLKNSVLAETAMAKVNLFSRAAIARAAKEELPMVLPTRRDADDSRFLLEDEDNEDVEGIRFVALGPRIFDNLRRLHNITTEQIASLFSVRNLREGKLKVKLQSGKGGAFFVVAVDGRFLIKSISSDEYDLMRSILPEYYAHFANCPSSYMSAMYGCYALQLADNEEIEPMYFVLMKNVLEMDKNLLPANTEIHCFDIKGSTSGRQTLDNPEEFFESSAYNKFKDVTLKDADFFSTYKSLSVFKFQAQKIMEELQNDVQFFKNFNLIDYSLLLFIVNIPYKTMGTRASSASDSPAGKEASKDSYRAPQRQESDKMVEEIKEKSLEDTLREEQTFGLAISPFINPNSSLVLQERAEGNSNLVYRLEGMSETLKAALANAANTGSIAEPEGRRSLNFFKQGKANVIPLTPLRKKSSNRSLIKDFSEYSGRFGAFITSADKELDESKEDEISEEIEVARDSKQ